MTTRRAVTYGGLTCLLAAWLASAASTTLQQGETAGEPAPAPAGVSTETLASEVQAHAAKLRQRLASAPTRPVPQRNPFLFEPRVAPARQLARQIVEPAAVTPEPLPPPEPVLALIGVAEDRGPKGLTRTAILAGDGDAMFMVTVGEILLGRYRVDAIGADAVELRDVGTQAVRRLGLR